MVEQKNSPASRFATKKWLLPTLGLAAIIIGAVVFLRLNNGIDANTYQLVRLDNGESYIGRLSGLGDEYVTLSSPFIYKEPTQGQAADAGNNEIQLLRVTSVDGDLRIAADQIIYWGNLPEDGKVVSAVEKAD